MKTRPIQPFVVMAAIGLGACVVPSSMFERASWGPPPDYWQDQGRYRQGAQQPAAQAQPKPQTVAPETTSADLAPLYAWDGGVVDGAPQGQVTTEEGTPRGVEAPPAGRAHIIELYQQALDERDALSEELEHLRLVLQQTTQALDAKTRESEDLSARLASLEAAHKELMDDNQSIAARLVQAQIRRLEAEKLLLENHIEIERAKAEEAARAAAQSRPRTRSGSATGSEEGDR